MKIIYDLGDKIVFDNSKYIFIDLKTEENIITKALEEPEIHTLYKEILKNDYIFYAHSQGVSKFCKRRYIGELFSRQDILPHKELFYTLEEPQEKKAVDTTSKKLLVIFPSMPRKDEFSNFRIPARMLYNFFPNVQRSLLKNLFVLRIMDTNLSHGSYFSNTENYPNFESDIQSLINETIQNLGIEKENVVFYGFSKGGFGALYHGSIMDFNVLSIDPIIDLGEYNSQNDRHFLKGFRKENMLEDINNHLRKNKTKNKMVFCSKNSPFNYKVINELDTDKVKIVSFEDKFITEHSYVCQNTIPEQLVVLNNFFLKNSLDII